MRMLTKFEALELLDTAWNAAPEAISDTQIEVTLGDYDAEQVNADICSYLAFLDVTIDPDSLSITPDHVEGSSIPATTLVIKMHL